MMKLLSKLFRGGEQNTQRAESWYFAENKGTKHRQVVLVIDRPEWEPPRLGTLMMTEKYHPLYSHAEVSGFFRVDNKPDTFLMVRVDDLVKQFRNSSLRIGFSFYRMDRSGLVGIYIQPQPPIVGLSLSFIEGLYGLDQEYMRDLTESAWSSDLLQLVLCDRSESTIEELAPGGAHTYAAPVAVNHLPIPLESPCREALMREWTDLLAFHSTIPEASRSFPDAMQQVFSLTSATASPIQPR